MVGCRFRRYFWIRNSNARHATTEVKVTTKTPVPKNTAEQMNAGISAMSTPYMFFSMESPLCT
jgi:hypothetical protein